MSSSPASSNQSQQQQRSPFRPSSAPSSIPRQPLSTSPLRPPSSLLVGRSAIPPPSVFAGSSNTSRSVSAGGGSSLRSSNGGYSYSGFGMLGATTNSANNNSGNNNNSHRSPGSPSTVTGVGVGRARVNSTSGGGNQHGGSGGQDDINGPRESSYFAIDIPILSLSTLISIEQSETNSTVDTDPSELQRDLGRRSRMSVGAPGGNEIGQELFALTFGGDRWRVEIYKPLPGHTDPANPACNSLYLSSQVLSPFLPDLLPTNLFFGIREPREQIGKRGDRGGWVWRSEVGSWCFGTGNEYYENHSFPTFESLVSQNGRIGALDGLVLTIQISSPVQATPPQISGMHWAPMDLFSALESLIDDQTTGDVIFIMHERSSNASMYRKRTLYAHKKVLKARSAYFGDLLGDAWSEGVGLKEGGKGIVRVDDFDFVTVYWLIYYLYTNEITFQQTEDVRLLPPDELPEGWLSKADQLGWGWWTVGDLNGHVGGLGDIAETSEESNGVSDSPSVVGSSPQSSSTNGKGKRRAFNGEQQPSSPTRTAAGRISPLGGRISPSAFKSSRSGAGSGVAVVGGQHGRVSSSEDESALPDGGRVPMEEKDPHAHPANVVTPVSALAIYRIAHRYLMPDLASLALCHIIQTLTPRTAFPLLLSTRLWPELHDAIKGYALANFEAVCNEPEFRRCYAEVGDGLWEHGGEVLLDFTLQLTPIN
ncbi:hypothetical protein T439DRAFT_45757 [Meredithblackwellia eburnea MCA 4105]